jgi:capsular polysaccharide biosynthesis protein
MSLAEYLQGHGERGEYTQIARFAATAPAMPGCVNGRRRDVFASYRSLVEAHRESVPVDVYTARLREVRVATADGGHRASVAGMADGAVFPELFGQGESAAGMLKKWGSDVPRLAGRTAVVTEISAGGNYYHWLLTALPKLLVMMYRYGRLKFDRVMVNDARVGYVRQTLELMGVPEEMVVSALDYPRVVLEEGIFGSVTSQLMYPHPLVAEMFRAVFSRSLYRGRRIYIARRGTRRILNEEELLGVLRPLNFEVVDLEGLEVGEQMRIFSQAECVISPHGAGLSNLIFAVPRTKVLELFSPQQVSPTYWYLANACSQEYHYLMGVGEDMGFETDNWRSAARPDLTVDAGDFAKAVKGMGLG